MEKYDNTNRGAIFKNSRKKTENHPDLTGSLNVEGKEYWVSTWKKTSAKGEPFYSVSINPKEEEASAATVSSSAVKEEIPF